MSPDAAVHGRRPSGDRAAAVVMDLVRGLVAEMRPSGPYPTVTLDSGLERELGLSSLELAELVVRTQDAFGRALPADTLAAVETPRDLLREVRTACRGQAEHARPSPVPGLPVAPEVAADADSRRQYPWYWWTSK